MPWTGRRLAGRYTVGERLGSGGMGAVYAATQDDLGRRVAIKILHPHLAQRPDLLTRFRREAMAAAALGHPNIVGVTDFAQNPGEPPFLVMEKLEGEDLRGCMVREGRLSAERVAFIAAQTLSALEAAHAAGIIHRDLKPENVFLTSITGVRDIVKVLDFGLAKHGQSEGPTLTETGAVMGTPAYMAPEQVSGQPVTPATDLYAVGALMFHALTGQLPFAGENNYAIMYAIAQGQRPSLLSLRPDLDPGFCAVVERAMAVDPRQRFANAAEMRRALDPFVRTSAPLHSYAPTPNLGVMPMATPGSPGEQPTMAGSVAPMPVHTPSTPPSMAPPPPVSSGSGSSALIGGLVGAVVVLVLVLGTGAYFVLGRAGPSQPAPVVAAVEAAPVERPTTPAAAPTPAPEPAPTQEQPAPGPEPAKTEEAVETATEDRVGILDRLGLREDEEAAADEPAEDETKKDEAPAPAPSPTPDENGKADEKKTEKKKKKKKKQTPKIPTGGTKPYLAFINAHAMFDLKVIRPKMKAILPQVTKCYVEHQYSPGDHIHSSYHLYVDEAGKVTRATKMGSRERSVDLDRCLFPHLEKLDFGTPKKPGKKIDITYTARLPGQ